MFLKCLFAAQIDPMVREFCWQLVISSLALIISISALTISISCN
jgi:hypothetical protein